MPPAKAGAPPSIQLEEIYAEKTYAETASCLELLLVSFMKHFGVDPKQAAGLLTQNNKYLSHIIAKGLKGDFSSVVSWYDELRENTSYLGTLIANEVTQGSIGQVLAATRPGFLTRNLDVVMSCSSFFSALGATLQDLGLGDDAWDWFTQENGGIDAIVVPLQKFKRTIRQVITEVFIHFARGRYTILFRMHLRKVFVDQSDLILFIHQFVTCIRNDQDSLQEVEASGLVDQWVDSSGNWMRSDQNATKFTAVSMICEIWVTFPTVFDDMPDMPNIIIKLLQTRLREGTHIQKHNAISQLFRLLSQFSASLNPAAPIVYKTLTFSLIENHADVAIRELFLNNFAQLFSETPSIPIGIVIDPIAKLMTLSDQNTYQYFNFDFTFFAEVARHPRVTNKHALVLLDMLGKIYLHDLSYSHAAAVPFMLMSNRFLVEDTVVEYLYRFASFALDMIIQLEKEAKTRKMKPNFWSNQGIHAEMDPYQKRNNILDMVSHIIQLESQQLNQRLKVLLLQTNSHIKRLTNKDYKGMMVLLSLLGDPERLLAQHERSTKGTPRPRDKGAIPKSDSMINRAETHIEKIKLKKLEKEQQIREQQERFKAKDDRAKRSLKKQINKRKVELGVTLNNEVVYKGNANLEVKKEEIKIFELEDESDIETVNIVLARYNHLLKHLFKHYSCTGYNSRKTNTLAMGAFESQGSRRATILEAEIYKILTDHGVTNRMLPKNDFHKLMVMYMQARGKTESQHQCDFATFKQLLLQAAMLIYSKKEHFLGFLPAGFSLLQLINYCRNTKYEKGEQTYLFDDPDIRVGDRDVVRRVNNELLQNPEAEIPENYIKVQEWEIDVEYRLPESIYIHPAYKMAYEILDGILFGALGTHFLEPQVMHYQYTRVRGILPKPAAPAKVPTQKRNKSMIVKPLPSPQQTKEEINQNVSNKLVNIAPQMRFLVAKQLTQTTEKSLTIEVANWLDKKLHQLELNEWEYILPKGNAAIESRQQKERQEQKQKEEAEKKRFQRMRTMKAKLTVVREKKAAQEIEESIKKRANERAVTEYNQQMKEYNQQMKSYKDYEIQVWKQQKDIEKAEQKAEQIQGKIAPATTKQERESFWKLQKLKLKQVDQSLKQQREQEKKDLEQKVLKAALTRKTNLQKHQTELERGRNNKQEDNQLEQELTGFYQTRDVQATIIMYEKELDTLYNFYINSQGFEMERNHGLFYKTFNKFAVDFNIFPGIVTKEDVSSVFRHMTKAKSENTKNAKIDQNEFYEALFRISIQGYEKLQVFMGKTWSELSFEMFEAIILWMEIPKNPNEALEKLNNMKSKHPSDKRKEAELRAKVVPHFTGLVTAALGKISSKSPKNDIFSPEPESSHDADRQNDEELSQYDITPF